MSDADCHICATLAALPPERLVRDDGTWVVFNVADVPGWTMIAPHEHVDGIGGLSEDQAVSLGPLLREVGAAVRKATGAERVHVIYLGDSARHIHLGLFPRQAGEPGLLDNARMVAEVGERQDAARAASLTVVIRESIAPPAG